MCIFFPFLPEPSLKHTSQIRKWKHIFPKTIDPSQDEVYINYKSLLTPACLPLTTDYVPRQEELQLYYQEYNYTGIVLAHHS